MKTRIILLALVLMGLTASAQQSNPEGNSFEPGQHVMLPINVGNSNTEAGVISTDDGTQINFQWEAGAQILVTVGSDTAHFTLVSGAGTASANFTGLMPQGGTTFNIEYPVVTSFSIDTQTYSVSEAIPHNKMQFTATNCSVSNPIQLTAQYAVLQLNLYGISQSISKIVVTNTSASGPDLPTYTLLIDPALTLPTDDANAQAFYIVVPDGSYKFRAEVFDNAATPASICKFHTSAAQTFTNGVVLNMPAKEVKRYFYLNDLFAEEVW